MLPYQEEWLSEMKAFMKGNLIFISIMLLLNGCAQVPTTDISLSNASILHEWEATLSVPNDIVIFPDGEQTQLSSKMKPMGPLTLPGSLPPQYAKYDKRLNLIIEAFISVVMEKMLSSEEFQSWATENKQPILFVALPSIKTTDLKINTKFIQKEILINVVLSGLCRVYSESMSSKAEYILRTTITSTSQRGVAGYEPAYYTCILQLFSLNGDQMGR